MTLREYGEMAAVVWCTGIVLGLPLLHLYCRTPDHGSTWYRRRDGKPLFLGATNGIAMVVLWPISFLAVTLLYTGFVTLTTIEDRAGRVMRRLRTRLGIPND